MKVGKKTSKKTIPTDLKEGAKSGEAEKNRGQETEKSLRGIVQNGRRLDPAMPVHSPKEELVS